MQVVGAGMLVMLAGVVVGGVDQDLEAEDGEKVMAVLVEAEVEIE